MTSTPTQDGRPIRIQTTLGPDVLLLERFWGREAISAPFEFHVDMLSTNATIDLKGLLSMPAGIAIRMADESERYIHGMFRKVTQLDQTAEGLTSYKGEIVPWFWFLTLYQDCRIFQNKNAAQIIEAVFSDRGFTDYEMQASGGPTREYCVQYRETDFNFVSRLAEEEGMFYFFKHTQDRHIMVIADQKSAIQQCEKQNTVNYYNVYTSWDEEDVIHSLVREQRVHTGTFSLDDFDFEKPNTAIDSSVSGDQKAENYDYPGRYKVRGDGDRYARIRLEAEQVKFYTVRGESNVRSLQSGYRFTLVDHFRSDTNQEYAITSLVHSAGTNTYRSGNPEPFSYRNEFEAIPYSQQFRPQQVARKPYIRGEQTAVVTGPSGEEIYPDKYGRVKVQFHWDREGQYNENSSLWVRVSQAWAGKGWGGMIIPRVGQEVIVGFLEGDPDQPIITGRVYNAEQMPSYTLPDEKTKSTLKTYSSKGGGGFNEIRFEDKKGEEQVFVHAQKDWDLRVKNDRREIVGGNMHVIVKGGEEGAPGDSFQETKGDMHCKVVGDQNEKVDGTISRDAGMDIQDKAGMNYALDAGMEVHIKAGMTAVIEAGTSLTIKVGGNFININPGGIFIKGTMVMINSGGAAGSGSGCSPTAPTAPDEADTAEPGEAVVMPPPPVRPVHSYGSQALAMKEAASNGAPFCDT